MWFRGQGKECWELKPKLLRTHTVEHEKSLINRFKQGATSLVDSPPKSEFEWLFVMQHYGLATRLLDWSENPLVGLYFAVNKPEEQEVDGVLWLLAPAEPNERSGYRSIVDGEIPAFDDEILRNYSPQALSSERGSRLLPMAAISPRNNRRMQAQFGVFTISHRSDILINQITNDGARQDHIWRYIIPATEKASILNELSIIGVNRFYLFPELESIAECVGV